MQDQSQQLYNMEKQQNQITNLLKLPTYNQNNFNLLNNLMSNPNTPLMNQQQQDVKQQYPIEQQYPYQKMQPPKEPNYYNKNLLPPTNPVPVNIPQTLGTANQYMYQNQYVPEDQGYQYYGDNMMQQQQQYPMSYPMPNYGVPQQYMDPYYYNQPQYNQYQYGQQQYGLGSQGIPKRYYEQEEGLDNIIFPSEKKLKKIDPRRGDSRENRRRQSRSKSYSRDRKVDHKKTLNITLSEGDWECGECNNWNFKRRDKCNQCGQEKSSSDKVYSESKGDSKKGRDGGRERISVTKKITHNQKGYKPKEGDWECKQCKNINYARREECNRCSNKRPN